MNGLEAEGRVLSWHSEVLSILVAGRASGGNVFRLIGLKELESPLVVFFGGFKVSRPKVWGSAAVSRPSHNFEAQTSSFEYLAGCCDQVRRNHYVTTEVEEDVFLSRLLRRCFDPSRVVGVWEDASE